MLSILLAAFLPTAIPALPGACRADASERDDRRARASRRKAHDGRRVHLDIEAQTSVPLDVGGRLNLEIPGRLRLSTSLGVLPREYVRVLNEIVVAAGGYDDPTARVVESVLSESLVSRTHIGWRPFRRHGFYLEAGYGLVTLAGGVTTGDIVALLLQNDTLAGVGIDTFSIESKLHMVEAEIGYQFLVARHHLSIRIALGYSGALASRTTVRPILAVPRIQGALQLAADWLEFYLDQEVLSQNVHLGLVTLAIGYRVF